MLNNIIISLSNMKEFNEIIINKYNRFIKRNIEYDKKRGVNYIIELNISNKGDKSIVGDIIISLLIIDKNTFLIDYMKDKYIVVEPLLTKFKPYEKEFDNTLYIKNDLHLLYPYLTSMND